MHHRSARPLHDLFLRPRVVVLLATLCLGGAGAAGVVAHDSDRAGRSPSSSSPASTRDDVRLTSPAAPSPSTAPVDRASAKRSTSRSPRPDVSGSSFPTDSPSALMSSEVSRSAAPPSPRATTSTRPSSPASVVERILPQTTLTSQSSAADTAVFAFTSDQAGTFTCSLDGGAFSRCASPASYDGLGAGWHTFAVRAVDTAGNVDPTAATTDFHTDRRGSE
jgi:hypothetical protein